MCAYIGLHKDLQMFGLKLIKYEYFDPLKVVCRRSETQLQVGENSFF